MSILAIDQGTTSTRALLVEESGTARIVESIEHRQIYPQPGWVEHDPEELIKNIQQCIDKCSTITSIGIDNQGESCLAWHAETKQAVTPVIVWQDNRTQDTVQALKADNAEDMVLAKSGLPLDSYFSASKLGWILKNNPEAAKLHQSGKLRMGTTDAFFLDRLTGRCVTDISTASRTSLMNLKTGQWDDELCRLFGVPVEVLPEIVPTTGEFGAIRSGKRDIPVTASVVDQQAALYGHGCRKPGDAKITFGTGAFALVVTGDSPFQSAGQGLLPTVAWQLGDEKPAYALDGGVYSAGSAVNWARSIGLFSSYDEINGFTHACAIERGLVFVPALSGLGCPHWDRSAAGTWIGLSLDTGAPDMMQSILEGIVFRTAEVINAMNTFISIRNEISIDGGLSANPYFCQFLADVLGCTIVVRPSAELTALGAAKLAAESSLPLLDDGERSLRYLPKREMGGFLEKFRDAVARSKGWRS